MQTDQRWKLFLFRQSSQLLWLTRSDSIWSLKTRYVFAFFLFICLILLLLFFDEVGFHLIPQDQVYVFCSCCYCCWCWCLTRSYGCCICCLLSFFSVKANSVKPGFPGKVFHCHFQCSSWSLPIFFVSSNFFFKTNQYSPNSVSGLFRILPCCRSSFLYLFPHHPFQRGADQNKKVVVVL